MPKLTDHHLNSTLITMQKLWADFIPITSSYPPPINPSLTPPSTGHWYTTMQKLWADFIPMPLDESDNHPCSFTAIFSDQYAASYYSVKWAEVT